MCFHTRRCTRALQGGGGGGGGEETIIKNNMTSLLNFSEISGLHCRLFAKDPGRKCRNF